MPHRRADAAPLALSSYLSCGGLSAFGSAPLEFGALRGGARSRRSYRAGYARSRVDSLHGRIDRRPALHVGKDPCGGQEHLSVRRRVHVGRRRIRRGERGVVPQVGGDFLLRHKQRVADANRLEAGHLGQQTHRRLQRHVLQLQAHLRLGFLLRPDIDDQVGGRLAADLPSAAVSSTLLRFTLTRWRICRIAAMSSVVTTTVSPMIAKLRL